jgi:hypothetical protein
MINVANLYEYPASIGDEGEGEKKKVMEHK